MNIHLTKTKKILLALLLIFSLCADTAVTALAGENPEQNQTSADYSYEDSSSNSDGSSVSGSPDKDIPSKDPSDTASSGKDSIDKLPSDNNSQTEGTPDVGVGPSEDNSSNNDIIQTDPPEYNDPSKDSNLPKESPTDEMDILPADEAEDAKDSAAETKTTFITLSAAGDCTLGIDSRYSRNFNKYYKKNGDGYFFRKVSSVFSQDDITIVNFEGTLTTSRKRAKKTFTFKGPKKYASILKKGSVEVVNLANNHSKDYGKTSLNDTQNTMRKNNIGYCRNTSISYQNVNDVKVAFLGFNALEKVTKNQIKNGITRAKNNHAKIIVVSFHWGVERKYYPNAKQKSLGHYAIDCGASLVLGHHPHVLQGIEKYNGRYIVYSLGNFCFGGNSNPKDKDTMIFQQTFSIKDGELQPENNAKIIPCSLSSRKKTNDFQPRILSGKEKKRLIKKMNKLSRKLSVSIYSDGKIK